MTPPHGSHLPARLLGLIVWLTPALAAADPALRLQRNLKGDFVLFGNTVAQDCASNTNPPIPAPVVGTRGTCPDGNPYAPDVYWRSDDPAVGQARADSNISAANARSSAVLQLPSDAEVVYARLYWGALSGAAGGPDRNVRVQRPPSFDDVVMADAVARVDDTGTNRYWYQSTADVTELVKSEGAGVYRLAGIASSNLVNLNDTHPVIAWFMVVLYQRAADPTRNLAIFDGLDLVDQSIGSASATLSGFLVPNAGFDAKLGVVAYEGEAQLSGDALRFNNSVLSDGVNPANNFFNASRSYLGSARSVAGDLPQLTGGPASLSNVDLDVVDVTSLVHAGDSSATIEASSTSDTFLLGAFITSITTFTPDLSKSQKSISDVNGGKLQRGDELEYRIDVQNDGRDASAATVLTDALPRGVSYVPGSLAIENGPNAGAKTDASGDDQAEYEASTRTVRARLGSGADATHGGVLAIGAGSRVRFRVRVDVDATGEISNQAQIVAQGERGSPSTTTPTDGNGSTMGQPPTVITVELCGADADCATPLGRCELPLRACVQCLMMSDCRDPATPNCEPTTHTCVCASGNCTGSEPTQPDAGNRDAGTARDASAMLDAGSAGAGAGGNAGASASAGTGGNAGTAGTDARDAGNMNRDANSSGGAVSSGGAGATSGSAAAGSPSAGAAASAATTGSSGNTHHGRTDAGAAKTGRTLAGGGCNCNVRGDLRGGASDALVILSALALLLRRRGARVARARYANSRPG